MTSVMGGVRTIEEVGDGVFVFTHEVSAIFMAAIHALTLLVAFYGVVVMMKGFDRWLVIRSVI